VAARRAAAVLLSALVLAAAAWPGCTVTRDNYKTLALFFDGVPDPDAVPIGAGPLGPGSGPAAGMLSVHKPYAEDGCSECHDSGLSMTRNQSRVCAKCHEGKQNEHANMHGPVAAQACLWCHSPHESTRLHLLRDDDRVVCGSCHAPALLSAIKAPGHAEGGGACLECHTGHGGPERKMLRAAPRGGGGAGTP